MPPPARRDGAERRSAYLPARPVSPAPPIPPTPRRRIPGSGRRRAAPPPPKVMSSPTPRSSNPSSSPSGHCWRERWYICSASPARSASSAPAAAAPARIWSASSRRRPASRSLQPQIARAQDAEISPSANAWAITGWAASRRIHPTAPAAAPLVTRVCQRSHTRALPCPSSSYPSWALKAASIRARAAVCRASARSSARSARACTSAGNNAASAVVSIARARSSIASASSTVAGSSAPHMLITSPGPGPEPGSDAKQADCGELFRSLVRS